MAGLALGMASAGLVLAIGYAGAETLTVIAMGRTLMGIRTDGIVHQESPRVKAVQTILGTLFFAVLAAVSLLELLYGQTIIGLATLSLVALGAIFILLRWTKRYRRPLGFAGSLLLLAMVLLIAAGVGQPLLRLIALLFAVIWGFFVALGAYNLFFQRVESAK